MFAVASDLGQCAAVGAAARHRVAARFPLAGADPHSRPVSRHNAKGSAPSASLLGHAAPHPARFRREHRQLALRLTGAIDEAIVTGWRQRPNGVKYAAWDHPLSPSYKDNKGGWLPGASAARRHRIPPLGGVGHRRCRGDAQGGAVYRRLARPGPPTCRSIGNSRLLAAGYDMDNMKARAFVESEMPLPGTDPAAAEAFATVARRLVAAAEIVAQATRRAVRDARYGRDAAADSTPLAAVYEDFWAATHDRFFALLPNAWSCGLGDRARSGERSNGEGYCVRPHSGCSMRPHRSIRSAVSCDPRRIVEARRNLLNTINGYGTAGAKLFIGTEPASTGATGVRNRWAEGGMRFIGEHFRAASWLVAATAAGSQWRTQSDLPTGPLSPDCAGRTCSMRCRTRRRSRCSAILVAHASR